MTIQKAIILIFFGRPKSLRSYDIYQFLRDIFKRISTKPFLKYILPILLIWKTKNRYAKTYQQHTFLLTLQIDFFQKQLSPFFPKTHALYIAYQHGSPSIESILQQCPAQNIHCLLTYPQSYSLFTEDILARIKKNTSATITVTDHFYKKKWYIDSFCAAIMSKSDEFDGILFSFHSIPEKAKTTYQVQCEETAQCLTKRIRLKIPIATGYQSQMGPTWLSPSIAQAAQTLYQQHVRHICVVPLSFFTECTETKIDLDEELQKKWIAMGGISFIRLPALINLPHFFLNFIQELEHTLF